MKLEQNTKDLIELGKKLNQNWLEEQIAWCIKQLEKNMQRFGDQYPSACATDGIYRLKGNDDWTNGFWTGMLWLAYEMTGKAIFATQALRNRASFQDRLDRHIVLDHHDIGFLYSLSVVAGYQLTADEGCRKAIIQAADVLKARYQEKGQFIQAWGRYGEPQEYRLIIDSLINLPLLYRASKVSGDQSYTELAKKHYQTVLNTVIREDGTTFHTYYFDPVTGNPERGVTHQGHTDKSIWARGQSWAILGIPLNQRQFAGGTFPTSYQSIVGVFIAGLPKDLVPYWDFDFTDATPSDKDSSALAIAACGLLEAAKTEAYPEAQGIAKGMIYQLGEHYTTKDQPNSEGLLAHGVYAHGEGKGVDEPNLWGDYFYLEALIRLAKTDWQTYW